MRMRNGEGAEAAEALDHVLGEDGRHGADGQVVTALVDCGGGRDDLARGGAAQHAEALTWYRAQPVPRDPALVRPVVPDHLVAKRADVDLGGRQVLLTHPGAGHTNHDVVVWSPDTGVLFAGDLIEQGADPDFTDAHPLEWPTALTELLRLGPRIVVPGHGDPVDAEFVAAQRDDLAILADLCQAVLAGRLNSDAAVSASPFSPPTTRAALARLHPPVMETYRAH